MKLGYTPVFTAVLLAASAAHAQAPEGLMKQDSATTGKTDVATEGFAAAAEREAETKDAFELKISAGGLLATGNSRSLAATASGDTRYRRGMDQLSAAVAANYARASADQDSEVETTVENYQGRIRYDRFLTDRFAVFIAASARRDRFQQLDLRLNIDPGVAYYFIDQKEQQLWGELGYDLQYDVRNEDAIELAAAEGEELDETETRHNGRAFAGYHNNLNEAVTFRTGVEYLQSLEETKNWRLNWDVSLSSQIGGNFSLATTFSLKYDNNPLPEVRDLDTVTAVSLVYQVL